MIQVRISANEDEDLMVRAHSVFENTELSKVTSFHLMTEDLATSQDWLFIRYTVIEHLLYI